MRMNGWRSVIAVACCVVISGCTTSRWVTDSRKEVISEKTASTVVPLLSITQYPEDKPELIVKLGKRLTGMFEVQEQQHEVIHTVWGTRINNFYGGLLALPFSPLALVYYTVDGKPKEGLMAVVNSFLAATGFNAFPGSAFYYPDQIGGSRIDKVSGSVGAQEIPWPGGSAEVTIGDAPPYRHSADLAGHIRIDLKSSPVNIAHPAEDLNVKISLEAGSVKMDESVKVTVATMLAWPAKEAEFARQEQEWQVKLVQQERERKAQEEREAIAKRERDAQQKREAVARREQERREQAAERERRAEERAESDANMALMMQGIGMLGEIAASQQQRNTPASVPPSSSSRSSTGQSYGLPGQNSPSSQGGSSSSGGSPCHPCFQECGRACIGVR